MGRHRGKSKITETNPVIRALKANKPTADEVRLAKDIEIIDKGWNNTAEGKADRSTNGASRFKRITGRHKK